MDVDIAIIGAGIAGLSAALACQKRGLIAHVFEAAPEFKPVGTSLSLWPNAMTCLSEWGVDSAIADKGREISQVAWRRPDGRPYFVQSLSHLYSDLGQRGYCVKRADLHAALVAAVTPDRLHTEKHLERIEPTDKGCVLYFSDETRIAARHVIAADGIWSNLRTTILNDGPPRYSGYGAWLGHSDGTSPLITTGEGCEFIGDQARLGVFETSDNQRYWFLVANRKTPQCHASPADPADCVPLIADWPAHLRDWVRSTPSDQTVYASFFERSVGSSWGAGPVTLIGDAMHPFVPNLGQGACQAIEDGHTIAHGLAQGFRGSELTQWMATKRTARVRRMAQTARRLGTLARQNGRLSRGLISVLGWSIFQGRMQAELRQQFTCP